MYLCTLCLSRRAELGRMKYFLPGILLLNHLLIMTFLKSSRNCEHVVGLPSAFSSCWFLNQRYQLLCRQSQSMEVFCMLYLSLVF